MKIMNVETVIVCPSRMQKLINCLDGNSEKLNAMNFACILKIWMSLVEVLLCQERMVPANCLINCVHGNTMQVMEDNLIERTTISHIVEAATSVSSAEVVKDETGVVVKENAISRMGNSSDEAHSIVCRRKKLIILDVNGLLADFVAKVPTGCKPDLTISRKGVFKRPFCDDFLQFCFKQFEVGVWSSRMRKNLDMAVDFLMGDLKHKLLFCWDQSHCTNSGVFTVDNKDRPIFFKELRKIWEKLEPDLPWENGEFNASNTILLDDSPYKALLNPANTSIFPLSYCYNDSEDASLGPGGDLRVYLEGIAMAENVQNFIEQNPFGQSPVTESHPSWEFYRLIVHSLCAKVEEEKEDNTSKALPAS